MPRRASMPRRRAAPHLQVECADLQVECADLPPRADLQVECADLPPRADLPLRADLQVGHVPARVRLAPPSAEAVRACADALASMILQAVLKERASDGSLTFSSVSEPLDGEVEAAPVSVGSTDGSLGKPRYERGSP